MEQLGVELELAVLYAVQTLGNSFFARFEVETQAWRKLLKWSLVAAMTLGLYAWVGHWALVLPSVLAILGLTFHFVWCKRNGIDPATAMPRRRYWELRGWEWTE